MDVRILRQDEKMLSINWITHLAETYRGRDSVAGSDGCPWPRLHRKAVVERGNWSFLYNASSALILSMVRGAEPS